MPCSARRARISRIGRQPDDEQRGILERGDGRRILDDARGRRDHGRVGLSEEIAKRCRLVGVERLDAAGRRDLRGGHPVGRLEDDVAIEERPTESLGQDPSDGRLAGAHLAEQDDVARFERRARHPLPTDQTRLPCARSSALWARLPA